MVFHGIHSVTDFVYLSHIPSKDYFPNHCLLCHLHPSILSDMEGLLSEKRMMPE